MGNPIANLDDLTASLFREVLGLPTITEDEVSALNEALEAGGPGFSEWASTNQEKLKTAYVTLDKQGFTATTLGDEETAEQVSTTMVIFSVYARRLGFTLSGPHSEPIPDDLLAQADGMVIS